MKKETKKKAPVQRREIIDNDKGLNKVPKKEDEESPKVSKRPIDKDVERVSNKKLTMRTRKNAFKRIDDKIMNPVEDFNPETFDPMEDDPNIDVKRRPRELPPDRLPTMGLKPKKIKEGQMVGMYESKQDLYLLIAWLSDRVTTLEEQLSNRE